MILQCLPEFAGLTKGDWNDQAVVERLRDGSRELASEQLLYPLIPSGTRRLT